MQHTVQDLHERDLRRDAIRRVKFACRRAGLTWLSPVFYAGDPTNSGSFLVTGKLMQCGDYKVTIKFRVLHEDRRMTIVPVRVNSLGDGGKIKHFSAAILHDLMLWCNYDRIGECPITDHFLAISSFFNAAYEDCAVGVSDKPNPSFNYHVPGAAFEHLGAPKLDVLAAPSRFDARVEFKQFKTKPAISFHPYRPRDFPTQTIIRACKKLEDLMENCHVDFQVDLEDGIMHRSRFGTEPWEINDVHYSHTRFTHPLLQTIASVVSASQ